jgi:hypothetical protein
VERTHMPTAGIRTHSEAEWGGKECTPCVEETGVRVCVCVCGET